MGLNVKILREPRYTIADAARMVGMNPVRVRRWLKGYSYTWVAKGSKKAGYQDPVIKHVDEEGSDISGVSFLDLIELLFARGFVQKGFSLQKIRAAMSEAKSILNLDYPFAQRHFFTNGRNIYLQVERNNPENLIQLFSGGQWVISKVIMAIAESITFDHASNLPFDWWPLGKNQGVIVSPMISFGAPSLVKRHIKTSNVHDMFLAEERDAKIVASWFGIEPDDVRAAVRFEEILIAA